MREKALSGKLKEEIAEQKAGMDAALNAGIDAFKEQFAKASEQEIVAKIQQDRKKFVKV